MTNAQMNSTINTRATELLSIKEVNKTYQSFTTETEAKDWIFNEALLTLLYSHEERVAMHQKQSTQQA